MLALTLSLIPICFLVDLIPEIKLIRSCKYNYFIECVAVFDNIFNTKILKMFNINYVAGADGWDRNKLLLNSLKHIVTSAKVFIFGSGAGTVFEFRPHNPIVSLWLDFGIIVPICYISLLVLLFKKIIKLKFSKKRFYLSILIITFLISTALSSLLFYTYFIFMIFLSALIKNINDSNEFLNNLSNKFK